MEEKTVSLAIIETLDLATQRDIAEKIFTVEGIAILKAEIKERSEGFEGDIETAAGRSAIISHAAKFSKDKKLVDKLRLEVVAAEKQRLKQIDASCKDFRDYCDTCRDDARQPVTDWEKAEADRVQTLRTQAEKEADEDLAYDLAELLKLQEEKRARKTKEAKEKEAKEAADRKVKADKERVGREAKIKADADAKAAADAKKLKIETRRKQWYAVGWKPALSEAPTDANLSDMSDGDWDSEIESTTQLKAGKDKTDQEAADKAAADKAERDKADAVAKTKADAKAAADEVERKRLARVAAAKTKADAEKAAAEKKASNKRHRAHVQKSVESNLIMAVGCKPKEATAIFEAIVGGEITHVTINF